jgi:hypothetical protein
MVSAMAESRALFALSLRGLGGRESDVQEHIAAILMNANLRHFVISPHPTSGRSEGAPD